MRQAHEQEVIWQQDVLVHDVTRRKEGPCVRDIGRLHLCQVAGRVCSNMPMKLDTIKQILAKKFNLRTNPQQRKPNFSAEPPN